MRRHMITTTSKQSNKQANMLKSGISQSSVEHSTTETMVKEGMVREFGYFNITAISECSDKHARVSGPTRALTARIHKV